MILDNDIAKARQVRFGMALSAGIFILGVSLVFGACSAPPADFSGYWVSGQGQAGVGAYFKLQLSQHGNKLSGQHDGGLDDGSRIDASIGEELDSVVGTVQGNVASLTITSFYSENLVYQAELILEKDGSASWKVTKTAAGQSYIPAEAKLVRQETKKPATGQAAQNEAIISAGNEYIEEIDEKILPVQSVQSSMGTAHPDGVVHTYAIDGETLKLGLEYSAPEGKINHEYYFLAGKIRAARLTIFHANAELTESDEKDASFELFTWYYDDAQKPILALDRNQNELTSEQWAAMTGTIEADLQEYHPAAGVAN